MAATQTADRSLTSEDLIRIRDTLATGRRPKVVFTASAGQIAGQLGQVVQLTDPSESEEWVVVRFGRDELPFSPADLAVPPRAAKVSSTRRASVVPPAVSREESSVSPVPVSSSVGDDVSSGEGTSTSSAVPVTDAAGSPPGDGAGAGERVSAARQKETAGSAGVSVPAGDGVAVVSEKKPTPVVEPVARADRRPAAARKAVKPKAPSTLTVTLTYADGEWMVGATQGSRALAKPYVVKPAEALRMVGMLDVPGVHEAVEEIVSAARADAEREAERLRAELAEVESRLSELRDAS